MSNFQKQSKELADKFSTLKSKELLFIDLISEVGELAEALQYVEGHKHGKMEGKLSKSDVADGLADIMWSLYCLAEEYGFDLDQEYKDMLVRLEKRIDSGEFKKK